MKQFVQNEEAVSPVIGVILMVAITVILAAVIAAFVFGMTGNVQSNKVVVVTAGQNGDNVVLTYQGGADASTLEYLKITVTTGDSSATQGGTTYISSTTGTSISTGNDVPSGTLKALPVGASISVVGGSGQRDHVVVVGHFVDGADQVVLDTYV